MKKYYLIIFAFIVLFIPTKTYAQGVSHEIGVKTGINYYVWTNDFLTGAFKSQIRPNIGIEYQVNLMKRFSLKTNVIYQKKVFTQGYSGAWGNPDPLIPHDAKIIYKNDNLFIPVLANWSFGNKAKFFMNIGPSLNYDFNFTGELNYDSNEELGGFGSNKLSFQYAFGFGFSTPMGEKMLFKGELIGNRAFPKKVNGTNQVEGINTMLLLGVSYNLPSS